MKLKGKIIDIIIFISSSICLYISAQLFYNMGIFVDENNLSAMDIYGSDILNSMDFYRLIILLFIVILSGINIFRNRAK